MLELLGGCQEIRKMDQGMSVDEIISWRDQCRPVDVMADDDPDLFEGVSSKVINALKGSNLDLLRC